MKLAISNIAWTSKNDREVYSMMNKLGYTGLEIAPTRVIESNPYDRPNQIFEWFSMINGQYGFEIPSMQSIWFRRREMIFGSESEREFLIDYTKKAIKFAKKIYCKNLILGCPQNRNLPIGLDKNIGVEFFKTIGDFAKKNDTTICMEAIPIIYSTSYINDTDSAIELIEQVDSDGFRLNLDTGTMIYNNESIKNLIGKVHLIKHVHISEPGLETIRERRLHKELRDVLLQENYQGYVSIEMKNKADLQEIYKTMKYVKEIFG